MPSHTDGGTDPLHPGSTAPGPSLGSPATGALGKAREAEDNPARKDLRRAHLSCPTCGSSLPSPTPAFCPSCGAKAASSPNASGEEPRSARSRGLDEAAATARQTVEQAAQTAAKVGAQAAQAAAQVGAQVGARFEQTVNDPQLLGRIPGRSVSIVGLGLMAVAILLSMLPMFYGIGLFWSLVMLLGGALTAFLELRSGGVALPQVKLPPVLLNPLIPPVFAALVAVQAFQLLGLGLVPLLWLSAAVLLGYDQYRKAILAPESFGRFLDFKQTWHGYRRYVLLGSGLCLLSLFFIWGESSGYLMGGYDYNYRYNSNTHSYGYQYDYNVAKYYMPGFALSGRSQGGVLWAEAALLALVIVVAYRSEGGMSPRLRMVALGLAGWLALWWLLHANLHLGGFLYLLGLLAILFAVFKLWRGEEAGAWDAAHMWARIRKKTR